MKLDKLDPKETPKLVALGVVCLGVVGYGLYSFLGTPPPPPPPAKDDKAKANPVPENPVAGMQLPPTYRADPFKPAVNPVAPDGAPPAPVASKAAGAGAGMRAGAAPQVTIAEPRRRRAALFAEEWPRFTVPVDGPGMTPLQQARAGIGTDPGATGAGSPAAGAPAAAPAPPAIVRPAVVVTGILSVDTADIALLEVSTDKGVEKRVVHVGDEVGNRYQVRKIVATGVHFARGKDTFFVALGEPSRSSGDPAAPAPSRTGS